VKTVSDKLVRHSLA